MNKLLLSIFLAAGMVSCQTATQEPAGQAEPATEAPRDGIFVHISAGIDDPHEVLMPLWLASMMTPDHDVLVFFDIKGVEVVLKDSPDLSMEPFSSSHTLIRQLIDSGAHVMVCPGCLEVAGKTMDDVMDGVTKADKELFFGFTKGRILSLDY